MSYLSETNQYRHETLPYCTGNGIDLGSGGDPVKVDGCISCDIGGHLKADVGGIVNLYADARQMKDVFFDEIFDFVYSSHLLEDFALEKWSYILFSWMRLIKPGGHLILLVPDHKLYRAIAGDGWNRSHQHEPGVGELSTLFTQCFPTWTVLHDRLAEPVRYTILFVARKP